MTCRYAARHASDYAANALARPRLGGDRRREASRHSTDSSAVFACRTATVASSVNPPEQRPSVSAATAHRRSVQPSSTARMARSRGPCVVAISGLFGSACACRMVGHPADLTPNAFALFARAFNSGASTGPRLAEAPIPPAFILPSIPNPLAPNALLLKKPWPLGQPFWERLSVSSA